MSDALEGTVVEDAVEALSATSTAVARRERRSEVIRPLDAGQLVESFAEYQRLLPQLLTDDDYQAAGSGKRFVKKSGWRKIATAFDLDVQIVRSQVDRDEHGQPLRAEVWARAVAPSGRLMEGDGYCSADEDRFSGPRGNKSKLENDLRATATTRAMNRAISGLVAMGEVSAEEIGGGDEGAPEWAAAATAERKRLAVTSLAYVLDGPDAQPVAKFALAAVQERLGVFPDGLVTAMSTLAKVVQDARSAPDAAPPPAPGVEYGQETTA